MAEDPTKHGNSLRSSLGLVIEKPHHDLLKMGLQTPLELTDDGDLLIVKPCRDSARDEQLREIHGRITKRRGKVLKRPAEQ